MRDLDLGGVNIIVEAATNNRNRTGQEIKNTFERGGGSLGGPGAVSFNFESKGFLLIEKKGDADEQILAIIDLGVDEVELSDDGISVYVFPTELINTKDSMTDAGYKVLEAKLIRSPKSSVKVGDESGAKQLVQLLGSLDSLDDVQNVFANDDIEDSIQVR